MSISVNMTKARTIHLEEIRKVRNAELVKEDVMFMRAVEAGDTGTQATIATKKQTLRNIPATFDITTNVDTPEKLKAKWPTELPVRE
jgi:energy-converting hydrogenase Eha subunit H